MIRSFLIPLGLLAVVWAGIVQESAPRKSGGPVSLLQVMAQPEKFHDQMVRVQGFLHLEFEGNQLHLHQEDFAHNRHAFWVERPMKWRKQRHIERQVRIIAGTTTQSWSHEHIATTIKIFMWRYGRTLSKSRR
jgi:hypothetical protein